MADCTSLRLVSNDGATLLAELYDSVNGLTVETVQEPEENLREGRVTSSRVPGSFQVWAVPDDGFLTAIVRVEGTSWAECTSRWQAVRAAFLAEPRFFIEMKYEGVTTTWRTERPNVSPGPLESVNLLRKRQTYQMRFRVQPNPVVTVA